MSSSRTSYHHASLMWEEVTRFTHSQRYVMIMSVCLTGLLTFFLIVLVWLGSHIQAITNTMQGKLGMYLYIKDTTSTEQIMEVTKKLESQGIQSTYFSKDDAAKKLHAKIPRIAQTLSTYKITNPLPATLSIHISSTDDYAIVASIIPSYKSFFTDSSITDSSLGIKAQEQRVIHALGIGNFIRGFLYSLIVLFVIIVVASYIYTIQYKISHSLDIIDVKKNLGASYSQIRRPYYILALMLLSGGTMIGAMLAIAVKASLMGHDDVLLYIHQISITRGSVGFIGLLIASIWILVGIGTLVAVYRKTT